ncbi:MAG: GNAT family N-acetyltransferase, partial [bacterium]
DIGGQPDRRQFYESFVERAMDLGWASIWFLKLNKEYLAYEILLRRGPGALGLAVDYDLQFRKSAPSVVLRSFILESLAGDGVREYDFGGADYDHKLQWTKRIRPHVRLWLFNQRLRSRLLFRVKRRLVGKGVATPDEQATDGDE